MSSPRRKLTDLHPRFYGAGGPGIFDSDGKPVLKREGLGFTCDCPCGCDGGICVAFANPIDGGLPRGPGPTWKRTGDAFETMSLMPSILRMDGCRWHGYLRNGWMEPC